MVFITDGEPNPLTSVNDAVTTAHDMINRTGRFAESSGNSVGIYAINVDLSNTQYTQMIDNTPYGWRAYVLLRIQARFTTPYFMQLWAILRL